MPRPAKALAVAVAVLLCVEGGARLILRQRMRSKLEDASAPVWCAGDSNTAGVGAPIGRGYPEQLAQALGKRVANLGFPGSNSAYAVSRVRERLEAGYRPETLVLLAGQNDGWNLLEVDQDLLDGSPRLRAASWAQRVKLFQLFRAAVLRVSRRNAKPAPPDALRRAQLAFERGDFTSARDSFDEHMAEEKAGRAVLGPAARSSLVRDELERLVWLQTGRRPGRELFQTRPDPAFLEDSLLQALGKGWCELQDGRPARAEAEFRRAAAIPGLHLWGRARALEGLGWALLDLGRPREAERAFRAAPSGEGKAMFARLFGLYAGLTAAAYAQHGREAARTAFEDIPIRENVLKCWKIAFANSMRDAARVLPDDCVHKPSRLPPVSVLDKGADYWRRARLGHDFLEKALRRSLENAEELARRHGVKLVLLTYPQSSAAEISGVLRDFASEKGLLLIDLDRAFAHVPYSDAVSFISEDGYHPSEAGYAWMAGQIAPALRRPR